MGTSIPNKLYHYCSARAFFGIIGTGKIFLTSAYLTNDYLEASWIWNFEEDVTKEFGPKIIPVLALARSWADFTKPSATIPFISCFSERPDMLSQWRGYAGNGTGFSIGFNPLALSERIVSPNNLHSDFGGRRDTVWGKVIYDQSDQRDIIFKTIRSGFESGTSDERIAADLFRLSTLIKNPAFCEEQEWRVVYMPTMTKMERGIRTILPKPRQVSDLKYREGNDRFYAYFELDFKSVTMATKTIMNVLMGPACRTDYLSIETYLLFNAYESVDIQRSSASYRAV